MGYLPFWFFPPPPSREFSQLDFFFFNPATGEIHREACEFNAANNFS